MHELISAVSWWVCGFACAVLTGTIIRRLQIRRAVGRCSGCDRWLVSMIRPASKVHAIYESDAEMGVELYRSYHARCVPASDRVDFELAHPPPDYPLPPMPPSSISAAPPASPCLTSRSS